MARPRILVVDDEPLLLSLHVRVLKKLGYDTQVATNAQAAMELVDAGPPDAVMLDLNMPTVNGIGLLYRLREVHPHMPVTIVTGVSNLDEATREEIRALNADLRFKPMTLADIQAVARDLLARRQPS